MAWTSYRFVYGRDSILFFCGLVNGYTRGHGRFGYDAEEYGIHVTKVCSEVMEQLLKYGRRSLAFDSVVESNMCSRFVTSARSELPISCHSYKSRDALTIQSK